MTVPTYAYYDPDYYPDPFKFDPNRWSPENKSSLNPYAYMPFGMGPRNCVGMRFAMEEIKIALCIILKQYRFFPVQETPDEMKFEDGLFVQTVCYRRDRTSPVMEFCVNNLDNQSTPRF